VSARDDLLRDLLAQARFYESLGSVGVPRAWAVSAAPAARTPAAGASSAGRTAPAPRAVATQANLGGALGMAPVPARAGARAPASPFTDVPVPPDAPAVDGVESAEALARVRAWLGDCQRCKLAGGRKQIVFGQGNPNARLMFVGEAPGADEDVQGLAFVGRAGQLLTDIIEKGLKMPREDVFIANVIKCRPPGNRNPEPDEISACQPFLERQIAAIRPRILVGLGKFACQFLLRTAEPITRLRGRMGRFQGIDVMPTYHPAYLLRNPSAKKDVWEDIKVVRDLLRPSETA
jgi:DNA polymerase